MVAASYCVGETRAHGFGCRHRATVFIQDEIVARAPYLCAACAFWHGIDAASLLRTPDDPYVYAIDPTGDPAGPEITIRLLAGGTLRTARLRCLGVVPAIARDWPSLRSPNALIGRSSV